MTKIKRQGPVTHQFIDEATIISDGSGNIAFANEKNISQAGDFSGWSALFLDMKINSIKVHMIPIGGSIAGAICSSAVHIQEEAPAAAPASFNSMIESYDVFPKDVKPAIKGYTLNVPIKDKGKWLEFADESSNQKTTIVHYGYGEYLPASKAVYKQIIEWNVSVR